MEADNAVMQRYPRQLARFTLDFPRHAALIKEGFDSRANRSCAGASIHPVEAKRAVKVRGYDFRALFADPDDGRWLREGKWRVVWVGPFLTPRTPAEQRTGNKPKQLLDRKSPIQVRILFSPAASPANCASAVAAAR
jgi:hypothetical protein